MCNACGFLCCAWDGFSKCGCDHCPVPACHDDECWACGEVDCVCEGDDFGDDPIEDEQFAPAFNEIKGERR